MASSLSPTAAELDAEITLLEERLYVLKRKRNAMSILYRYPLEILEHIIHFIQVEEGDDVMRYSNSRWTGLNRKWGRTMLICRIALVKYDYDESTKRTFKLFDRASGIRLLIPAVDLVDRNVGVHKVEVHRSDADGSVTRVLLAPALPIEQDDPNLGRLALRVVCPTDGQSNLQVVDIARFAECFVIPQSPAQLPHFEEVIKQCWNMHCLSIWNAYFMDTHEGDADNAIVRSLKRILAELNKKSGPLRSMEFKFLGSDEQHAISNFIKTREKVMSLSEGWKLAGLVVEVEYQRVWTKKHANP